MKPRNIAVLLVLAAAAGSLLRKGEFLYAGTVEATEIDISSRLSSTIASFDVKEGRPVKAGQVMVRLSCEDVKLAADIAERDFKRAQKLRDGAMTEEAYDRLRYKRDDAQLRLDWCAVKAPLDATVLAVYHEADESVSPGARLLTLADLSEVCAMVYVPQPQTREERTRLVYGVKVSCPQPGPRAQARHDRRGAPAAIAATPWSASRPRPSPRGWAATRPWPARRSISRPGRSTGSSARTARARRP